MPVPAVSSYRPAAGLPHRKKRASTADNDNDDEKPTIKVPTPSQARQLHELREEVTALEVKLKTEADKPEIAASQLNWEKIVSAALNSWQMFDPTGLRSAGGATLTMTESKSIQTGGANPKNDTYIVMAQASPGRITGLRLEMLETGKEKALGRHENGRFVLTK